MEGEGASLLENALTEDFLPPSPRKQPVILQGQQFKDATEVSKSQPLPLDPSPSTEPLSESSIDEWKSEYDSHVESWRAQSAAAREKAQKERERWEALRANEKLQRSSDPSFTPEEHSEAEWENVSHLRSQASGVPSPSPADVGDLVRGETNRQIGTHTQQRRWETVPRDKWETVAGSMDSSFPSMSFPEHPTPYPPVEEPQFTPTLAIFDSSLSTRTRVTALFSSLAINLFLPFVNGVMLGFGEVFAKNVLFVNLKWPWKSRPGLAAAGRGLGFSRASR